VTAAAQPRAALSAFFGTFDRSTHLRLSFRSRYPACWRRLQTTGQRLQRGLSLQHLPFDLIVAGTLGQPNR
jgi:hypothetical protein